MTDVWQPYVTEEPLVTPPMVLGLDQVDLDDRERLSRYLSALVASRSAPIHVNVAFNAVYFGYDLDADGYVGGPLELDAFPTLAFGSTTDALPVGAMVNVATGTEPLFAEVVYKEGRHDELGGDGALPAWLSGAPAGATGPGETGETMRPVLTERLVIDVDAFGQGLSTTTVRLDRLRQRGKWLDADGHLLLRARYSSPLEADLDDVQFYTRCLLTSSRNQLLSAAAPTPLSTLLSDDAGEEQLAAALAGLQHTIATALSDLPEVRMWRGYAFSRASLGRRLRDQGPLGGPDLSTIAAQLAHSAVPTRPSRWAPPRSVTYTAVGPRLRDMDGAASRLAGVGYAEAVCHANAVISDHACREVDEETGLLPGNVHLRLDDPWQGGGVWRAEYPDSLYRDIEVTEPLGLGWLGTLPEPVSDKPERDDAPELAVTDSQISWNQPLRLKHQLERCLPLPDAIAAHMRGAGLSGTRLRLLLTHDGYALDPAESTQRAQAQLAGRPGLEGVDWPLEFFPGIVLTCTWPRGAGLVRATSTLLEQPVTIDGEQIEHRYMPGILTREAAPGTPRRGQTGATTLTLAQRVLRAVRRLGLLDIDGRAVLARSDLARAVYGQHEHSGLGPVIEELVTSGRLHTVSGNPNLIGYEPNIVAGTPRQAGRALLERRYVREQRVAGHVRQIAGKASDDQRAAYREDRVRFGLVGPAELPSTGYTYIRPFSRGGR
jgi:hypothetical protein